MLTRYAERRGFKTETLSSSESDGGGVKEIVFAVKGDGAYSVFKWEGGTHRVQRVPETESQGRIHTSTATVAVMPEVEEVEVDDRGQGPQDRRVPLDRPWWPERQHDRLGRAHHAPADRDRGRDAGREVAAPEQAEGDARPARAPLRGRARAAARRAGGRAEVPGRHGRAGREDPHLQLPREPTHRPSHQAHGAPARPDPRRRPRGVHRRAPGRGARARSSARSEGSDRTSELADDDRRRGPAALDRPPRRQGLGDPAARRRAAARASARLRADRAVHAPRPAAHGRRARRGARARRAARTARAAAVRPRRVGVSPAHAGRRPRVPSSHAPRPRSSSSARSLCSRARARRACSTSARASGAIALAIADEHPGRARDGDRRVAGRARARA